MRLKLHPMAWCTILFIVVVALLLIVPPNPASLNVLHVNPDVYRLIIISLVIPYAVVWFSAFYAYSALEEYTSTITDTREGRAFNHIVRGLKVLAWGLILNPIIGQLLALLRDHGQAFVIAQSLVSRYLTLGIALVAFIMIQDGTYILTEIIHARRTKASMRFLVMAATVVGVFFIQLVLTNSHENANPYFLPWWLLLVTFIIPYICTWVVGAVANYELRLYARRVKGILYQRSLQFIANGLSIFILTSIAAQYITAAYASRARFSLSSILLLVYALLLFQAIGLVLVAGGAKQLKKFEEV